MGWGIWHILCIKEHFFINSVDSNLSRGLSTWLPSFLPLLIPKTAAELNDRDFIVRTLYKLGYKVTY